MQRRQRPRAGVVPGATVRRRLFGDTAEARRGSAVVARGAAGTRAVGAALRPAYYVVAPRAKAHENGPEHCGGALPDKLQQSPATASV
eukprot:scaffold54272_cov66-Phaeocystis_antarctica.AAC.1